MTAECQCLTGINSMMHAMQFSLGQHQGHQHCLHAPHIAIVLIESAQPAASSPAQRSSYRHRPAKDLGVEAIYDFVRLAQLLNGVLGVLSGVHEAGNRSDNDFQIALLAIAKAQVNLAQHSIAQAQALAEHTSWRVSLQQLIVGWTWHCQDVCSELQL